MHLSTLEAYILDLDGVVTHTAQLHSVAWKRLFDEYRETRKRRGEPEFQPFDIHDDYLRYVDGKTRIDGVRSFLETRGIRLPEGRPDDPADFETVNGLGNLKNTYFDLELKRKGPEVFPDAIEALGQWRRLGFKTAIASSSKNCEEILRLAGLTGLFDARVDGTHIERWGMPGKPAPDMFLAAARLLEVEPSRAAVLEDAISGVQAARAGQFGLVVGIARFGHPERLKAAGADIVVSELTAVPVPKQARRPEPGANP